MKSAQGTLLLMLIGIRVLPLTELLSTPMSIGRIQGFIVLLYDSLSSGALLGVVGDDDGGWLIHDGALIP